MVYEVDNNQGNAGLAATVWMSHWRLTLRDEVITQEAYVNHHTFVDQPSYRFGFGNHEKIDEVNGSGNTVDMGDRWLDTRTGRTYKQDRKANEYPFISPYTYAADNTIIFIDPDGK